MSGAVGFGLLALQNGSYYIPNVADYPTANQWVSFAHTGLTASDFSLIGGSSHPDFSASGSPIEFGYYTSNGTGFGTGHTDSGIDNYSASIVPEPSSTALILFGTVLCFRRRLLRTNERSATMVFRAEH